MLDLFLSGNENNESLRMKKIVKSFTTKNAKKAQGAQRNKTER